MKSSQKSPMKTLLIVDDDETSHVILRFLKTEGYCIIGAMSGNQAIRVLQSERVDLIISDIEMPDGGGLELLSKLRSSLSDPPPLIFLSSRDDLTEAALMNLGAERFFRKPVDREALLRAIESVLVDVA